MPSPQYILKVSLIVVGTLYALELLKSKADVDVIGMLPGVGEAA